MSHDVEGNGQHNVTLGPRSRSKVQNGYFICDGVPSNAVKLTLILFKESIIPEKSRFFYSLLK